MPKSNFEIRALDLNTELQVLKGDVIRLGHPKGAMAIGQACMMLAQYQAERAAVKSAADAILAPMTMEVGRLMEEAPDHILTITAYGQTIEMPAGRFMALYRATDF